MTFAFDSMRLLGTSGDGSLSVCNLQSNKLQTRSEFSEDELLSVIIMKNSRKVICGTQTGTLLLYSWGFFKDRSLMKTELLLDLRMDSSAFSHDKKFLGSISHDHTLKLWDVDNLLLSSGSTIKSHSAVADSDSDEMDMDLFRNLPKLIKMRDEYCKHDLLLRRLSKKYCGFQVLAFPVAEWCFLIVSWIIL